MHESGKGLDAFIAGCRPPFSFSFRIVCHTSAVCQGDGLLSGEFVHQWRCVDVERLESQALPVELQNGTGPLHRSVEPTVKLTSLRSCSTADRVIQIMLNN